MLARTMAPPPGIAAIRRECIGRAEPKSRRASGPCRPDANSLRGQDARRAIPTAARTGFAIPDPAQDLLYRTA